MIKTLEYNMGNEMKNAIYNSCKDVVNPTTSAPALAMMCGTWGMSCTPEKFYEFVGDVNAWSPFQINYVFWDDEVTPEGLEPRNRPMKTCDQAIPGQDKGCSCSDCELACEIPNFEDEEDDEFVIVEGVDGVVFIMVVIFVVGSIIFLASIIGSNVLKKSDLQCKFF